MSREPRQFSTTGLYHIIFRGISRQNIFEEEQDYAKLIEVIKKVKDEEKFELYAFCLMTNHVHLFIKENEQAQISKVMKKILTHYALWYNKKYERTGSLFGERYKSEPVEDQRYYLSLIRYIHQNPLKAGLVEEHKSYKWSSYNEYICGSGKITDISSGLSIFSEDKKKAIELFKQFNEIVEFEKYEITQSRRKTAEQVRRLIMSELGGKEPNILKELPRNERDDLIKKIILKKSISKSEMERATGISRGTIMRIINKM